MYVFVSPTYLYHGYITKRGGGLSCIEDSVDASIRGNEEYVKKNKEKLITAASNSTDNVKIKRITKTKKQKCEKNKCTDITNYGDGT